MVPKWFFVPNIFLAGFLSCGLPRWLERRAALAIVVVSALVIAGVNFLTAIRPRHYDPGPDRTLAECVAGHMQPADAFIAAEWGWTDYLTYVHKRTAINLVNETAFAGSKEKMLPAVKGFIASKQQKSADVYFEDPRVFPETHLAWLKAQTGVTFDELLEFQGSPAFMCAGRTFLKLSPAAPSK